MAYRVKIGARLDKDIRRLLATQTGRAIGYLSGAIDQGGSSIHATRKALKRCRSILRLARQGLTAKTFATHDRAFRDIARLLSHDRDREVMTETLRLLAAKSAGDDKAALLAALDELNTINLNGVAHLAAEDAIARAMALLQAQDRAIHRLNVKKARIDTLADGFATTYAEGRKALKAAYRINDDEAFHTFRKALQHHWRHCQLLLPAWPDLMNVRISTARDLSQLIGNDHDLSLVIAHFKTPAASALSEGIRARIVAAAKAEQAQLRAEVKPLARRLYALDPADMERLIVRLWPAARRLAKHHRKPEATDFPVEDVIPLKSSGQS
jgi:hypothetical protein